MFDLTKLRKVLIPILFVVFFIWIQFWLHLWFLFSPYQQIVCNYNGPLGIAVPSWAYLLSAVVVLGGVFSLRKQPILSLSHDWPLLLLLAGGLGNVLERLSFQCIMDYMTIPFFPVFNIADVALTVGVIGVVWKEWNKSDKKK